MSQPAYLIRTAAVAAISAYKDLEVSRPTVIDGLTVSCANTDAGDVWTVESEECERLISTRELMYHAYNGWRIRARLLPEVPA